MFSREFAAAAGRRPTSPVARASAFLTSLRVLRLLGVAAVMVAPVAPWFRVPAPVGMSAQPEPVMVESAVTMPAKAFLVCALSCAVLWGWRRRRAGAAVAMAGPASVSAVCCVLLLVTFPSTVVQRDARVSAQAAFLQAQHDNLTWLGGDIWCAKEYAEDYAKSALDVKDPPRRFIALPSPPASAADFGPARLGELMMWIGYTPGFCQFAGAGWFLAVLGTGFLALGCSDVVIGSPKGARGLRVVAVAGGALFASLTLALMPARVAGVALAEARSAVEAGDPPRALAALDRAEAAVPVLAWHTDMICQRGRLLAATGGAVSSPEAEIARGVQLELHGASGRAGAIYEELSRAGAGPVAAEARRGLLRLACVDFNSGRVEFATKALSELVAQDASQLKAWYVLTLADLAAGRRERLKDAALRMDALYRRFRAREKAAVLSFLQHHLAEAAAEAGDLLETEERQRRVPAP